MSFQRSAFQLTDSSLMLNGKLGFGYFWLAFYLNEYHVTVVKGCLCIFVHLIYAAIMPSRSKSKTKD